MAIKTAVHGNKTSVHGNKTAVYWIVYALTDIDSIYGYRGVYVTRDHPIILEWADLQFMGVPRRPSLFFVAYGWPTSG